MKSYDIEKAKVIINNKTSILMSASIGLYEDWFWTASTVFENFEWTKEINQGDEIAGLTGSTWATPVVRLFYLDGTDECIPCYMGDSELHQPIHPPAMGCLSEPCQNAMPPIRFESLD